MRYREIISEIELGGEVDSNILEPFPEFHRKPVEPRQLEMFKEYPPLTANDVTDAGYKPLGKIGKYVFAEMVKETKQTGFKAASADKKRTFLLFNENLPIGIVALVEPSSEDGSGYSPARGLQYNIHGTGYRISVVKIDPKHSGQNLALQCYYFLLTHVCDFLMADTLQTMDGAALWRKMLNSKKFRVLVYDDNKNVIRRRWAGKDFQQVYNNFHLHPIVMLPSEENYIVYGDEEDLNESIDTKNAISLDPFSFDQTSKGWRSMPDLQSQASLLSNYITKYVQNNQFKPTTPKGSKSIRPTLLYWHLGQIYAMQGKTILALQCMKQSIDKQDSDWNNYVKSTICFLRKDRKGFDEYASHSSQNENTLNRLRNAWGQPYSKAY